MVGLGQLVINPVVQSRLSQWPNTNPEKGFRKLNSTLNLNTCAETDEAFDFLEGFSRHLVLSSIVDTELLTKDLSHKFTRILSHFTLI